MAEEEEEEEQVQKTGDRIDGLQHKQVCARDLRLRDRSAGIRRRVKMFVLRRGFEVDWYARRDTGLPVKTGIPEGGERENSGCSGWRLSLTSQCSQE